jgi:ureidoglycolate hydrolase
MARMTARRLVTLPALNAVAVSSVATATAPVGARKYHALYFQYKDGTANQATLEGAITNVRLLLNGKEQWNCSLARLNILNALVGYAFQTGLIFIPLSRFDARTPAGEEAFGWGTADVSSFTVELTISGAAVAPALTGWAEIEDTVENIGVIIKRRTHSSKAASGAGLFQINDLPRKPLEAYARLHLFSSAVTSAKVVADSVEFFDLPRAVASALYAKQGITQQSNVFHVLFDATEQVTDLLPMTREVPGIGKVLVQDFRLDLTMSGASTFDIIAEVVGIPD